MKWMGWSWQDLYDAPRHVVDEIRRMMIEEQERIQQLADNQ